MRTWVLCGALACGALACGGSSGKKSDASGQAGAAGGAAGAAGSSDAAGGASDGSDAGGAGAHEDARTSDLAGDVTSEAADTDASDGGVDAADAQEIDGPCHPILNQAGLDTGLESCDDGSQRRRAALECPTEKTADVSPCAGHACTSDDQCTAQPGGYCADAHKLVGYCGCWYGCRKDADCAAGSLCQCGVILGQCVPATCTTNADCGPGLGCAANVPGNVDMTCISPFRRDVRYSCQSPNDECQQDKDCPAVGNNQGACVLQGGNHRVCSTRCYMKV